MKKVYYKGYELPGQLSHTWYHEDGGEYEVTLLLNESDVIMSPGSLEILESEATEDSK